MVLGTFLEQLSRGILGELPAVADLPPDERRLGELLITLRERWKHERRETIEQAVSALGESARLYNRERERAEELEAAHAELQETQAQLVHAGKLASLGTLAAGVAHEINQPLTVILSLAELSCLCLDDPADVRRDRLEQILRAADRIGRIVDNIRTFGRQDSFHLEPTPALQPLESALDLFRARFLVDGIALERRYDLPADRELDLDPSRMQQVFVNLLANARDILRQPGTREPRPTIRLSVSERGGFVRYAIEDNGPGAPPDVVGRIFDPFFTTKGPGDGTGLGLSLSHSIVEEHGGELSYRRRPPWTRLLVALPTGAGPWARATSTRRAEPPGADGLTA